MYYIEGNVSLNGNYQLNGIVICEGTINLDGGPKTPDVVGGLIQLDPNGEIKANGQPVDIQIVNDYFDIVNDTLPIVNVISWQESVSAN